MCAKANKVYNTTILSHFWFNIMSVVRLNDLDFQASGARLEVKTSGNSKCTCRSDLVPVVQTLDSAIHQINHYPVDRY